MIAQKPAKESKEPKAEGTEVIAVGAASQAKAVTSRHEVPRTGNVLGPLKKLPGRADGLEPMVFDDDWYSREKPPQKGSKSGARNVNHVGLTNQVKELQGTGLSNNSKGQIVILKIASLSLRCERDFKWGRTIRGTILGQPTRKGQHDGFYSSNARSKEMGVDEEFH
jgi:hypothetical protein